MTVLSIDFETYSTTDLIKSGLAAYAADPTCEVLICSWSVDFNMQKSWVPHEGPMPVKLKTLLMDHAVRKTAFNVAFEQTVLKLTLGIEVPTEQWFDTMVLARQCALPATLQKVSEVTGGAEKDKAGKALIRFFSIPRKPTKTDNSSRNMPREHPEKFAEFVKYCEDDVRAENAVLKQLGKYAIKSERDVWLLDQKINERGIPFDMDLVNAIDSHYTKARQLALIKIRDITGLENPNSRNQVLGWLKSEGYSPNSLTAEAVEKALLYPNGMSAIATEVLELRMMANVSSAAKYKAVQRSAVDGLVKGTLTYYGASRTGRFAGRIYQPQNLPRPDYAIQNKLDEAIDDTMKLGTRELVKKYDLIDLTRTLTRPIVKADEGKAFAVADLSSVESVVLGWVAEEPVIIEGFRDGKDTYKLFAVDAFGVNYDDVTKEQRTQSKPAVLGAGFRLGPGGWGKNKKGEKIATGLFGYSKALGVYLSIDDCERMVGLWREKHKNVVSFWQSIENAVWRTIVTKKPVEANKYIRTQMNGPFLEIILPSGRPLRYFRPAIQPHKTPWGEIKDTISYLSPQFGMVRDFTHGGKLTENCFTGDTLIATAEGPKRIDTITNEDYIWDGVEYVKCDGSKQMGRKKTVNFKGVNVTPDHKILTDEGWRSVEEIQTGAKVYRLQQSNYGRVRKSSMSRFRVYYKSKSDVGPHLRVREYIQYSFHRLTEAFKQREEDNLQILFVQRDEQETWDVRSPSLRRMAVYDRSLPIEDAPSIQELWGSWDNCMRRVGKFVRDILEGYGPRVSSGSTVGQREQQLWVQQGELPVGNTDGELSKQEKHGHSVNPVGEHNTVGSFGEEWDREVNTTLSNEEWRTPERHVQKTGHDEQVYDIINCGPRNRFVVCGEVEFIAHNCVQAIARDVLVEGLKNSNSIGQDIVMHVHDEIIVQVDEDKKDYELGRLIGAMTKIPSWGDSDLILKADGYTCPRYVKD